MNPRRWALKCFASVVATMALPQLAISQTRGRAGGLVQLQARRIFGEVLSKDNKPIDSVLVTAYRQKIKIGEDTTKNGGMYSLSFSGDQPVDTVRYQQTAYIDGVVDDLCGSRDQNISKTLYLKGTPLNLFEGQEALAALERIFYLEEGTDTFKTTVAVRLNTLDTMKGRIPARLDGRLNQVRALYQAQA